ncbi:MAG TPA: alpha/beta fold hydrolase [Methylocella sp.]|nr:alpha/beta fold hydrolase [Methylocella sp.]
MTDLFIDGHIFNVLIEGEEDRPALVLSHPMGCNLHFWDAQIPALTEHFRVIRYDTRGHGGSVANEGPYSLDLLGCDALAILDALSVGKAHWMGLSMGSIIGLWLLIHAGGRIGRAVLANTSAYLPGPDLWNGRIEMARSEGMEAIAAGAAERWFRASFRDAHPEKVEAVLDMVRATPVQGYVAACASARDFDLREAIRGLTHEVLVIAGQADPSTTKEMSAAVAKSIKGAKLITLKTSHMSSIEDEAHFTKAVLDFLTAPETHALPAKAPPKKTAAEKARVKKAQEKKPTAKTAPAKKPTARRATPKKGPVKKGPVKKGPVKKFVAKKAASKKSASRPLAAKSLAKKSAAKKSATKKKTVARNRPAAKKGGKAKKR